MSHDLESVAATLVADGKGILAADETVPTLTKRFDTLGIPSTEQSRRTYREMHRAGCGGVHQRRHHAGRDHPAEELRRHTPRRGSFEAGHPSRHQGRHRRKAARGLSRRNSNRGARRAPGSPLRVPWHGRPLREVAGSHPYHGRSAERRLRQRECACAALYAALCQDRISFRSSSRKC